MFRVPIQDRHQTKEDEMKDEMVWQTKFGSGASFGSFAWVGENTSRTPPLVRRRTAVAPEVGDYCGKTCGHCIYSALTKNKKAGAPDEGVTKLQVAAIMRSEAEVISLAGREAIAFPKQSMELLAASTAGIKILMTSFPSPIGELESQLILKCTDVDVSLDGDERFHNQLRNNKWSWMQTMERSLQAESLGVRVAHIATPCSDESIDSIIRMADQMPPARPYSMSLYYGRPGDPMILSYEQIVRLVRGLNETSLKRGIVPIHENYAWVWMDIKRELGIRDEDIEYCLTTGIPIVKYGNVDFLLFHLSEGWNVYRLAHRGGVYGGCSHLILEDPTPFALGRLGEDGVLPPQKEYPIPLACQGCKRFKDCGGGDMLSGKFFGLTHDPFCKILN